jgi:hypothetical protein
MLFGSAPQAGSLFGKTTEPEKKPELNLFGHQQEGDSKLKQTDPPSVQFSFAKSEDKKEERKDDPKPTTLGQGQSMFSSQSAFQAPTASFPSNSAPKTSK